jgi:hypothetical protein
MNIRSTSGSGRILLKDLSRQAITDAQQKGTLVVDGRRQRPFYFDGRFLAARDLTRDQEYFLTRQADLCRVFGAGVFDGLRVTRKSDTSVSVAAGLGVTPAGDMVAINDEVTVDLGQMDVQLALNVAFGLKAFPQPSAANRTGLFVLALRPVEYTANAITAYPTTITGTRTTEDGDIIEAVALTLVPFITSGTPGDAHRQRSAAARGVFGEEANPRGQGDVLPLAVVALKGGLVDWIDEYLVRREIGAEHSGVVGFGLRARALREAHLLQYDTHLAEVQADRVSRNLPPGFTASEYFDLLPPVGRLPVAAVDGTARTQRFFPAGIDVQLSVVPDDELAPLVEESILLPPFDLTLPPEDIDNAAVLIVAPVSRALFRTLRLSPRTLPVRFPVAGILAGRRPLDLLRLMERRTPELPTVPADDATGWGRALAELPGASGGLAWYVRRRALSVVRGP